MKTIPLAQAEALARALKVLALTHGTVAYLLENDPQALQQALLAVRPFTDDPMQIDLLDAALLDVRRVLKGGPALTDSERRVLAALRQQAESCSGGDFALVEQVNVPGLSRQALGGVLTSLQAKDVITVWEPTETNGGPRNGGERWTQVTINADPNKCEHGYAFGCRACNPDA